MCSIETPVHDAARDAAATKNELARNAMNDDVAGIDMKVQ
jgi:hypothetical protein